MDNTDTGPKRLVEEVLIKKYLAKGFFPSYEKKDQLIKDEKMAVVKIIRFEQRLTNHNEMYHERLWKDSNECIKLSTGMPLVHAYANRAKLLEHFGNYEASIEDCERAWRLMSDNNKELKVDMAVSLLKNIVMYHDRMKRRMSKDKRNDIFKRYSELKFKSMEEKKFMLQEFIKDLNKIDKYDEIESSVPKKNQYLKFDRNDRIPWASKSLEVRKDQNGKLQVVATRNIEPGEILAVNKKNLFYSDINPDFNDCIYCRKFSWTPIPCDTCSYAIYCSDNCKIEHWNNYHRWECNVIPIDVLSHGRTPFYLFLQLVQQAGGYDKFVDYIHEAGDKRSKGLPNPNFDEKDILSFYTNKESQKKLVLHPEVVANSVKIAYYLAKETDFLGKPLEKGKKITKDNKIITLAAGLARCYTLTKQNFFHYFHYHPDRSADLIGGHAIYSFVRYFQHDCAPNACLFTSRDNNELVIFAKNLIEKGSEIKLSYSLSTTYSDSTKEKRKMHLSTFPLICSCEACINDWSSSDLKSIRMLLRDKKDFIFLLNQIKAEYQPLLDDLNQRSITKKGLPFSYIEKITKVLRTFSEFSLENSIEFEIFSKYLLVAYIAHYGNLRETETQGCNLQNLTKKAAASGQ